MKIRVGVLFGGRSVEHEVSVISGIQAIHAFDKTKYETVPLYISKTGEMFAGDAIGRIEEYRDIPVLLKKSQRVFLHGEKDRCLVVRYPMRRFGSSLVAEIDVAFPVTHGTNVEDGTLQGYLKTLSVPFVGSDVTASAVGMDKYVMKAVWKECGLPVLDCKRIYAEDYYGGREAVLARLAEVVPWPAIVKPVNLGSSVGIRRVGDAAELQEALDHALRFADTALVERAVPHLREINCSVLGDRSAAAASECEEPIGGVILSYSDKYLAGAKNGGAKGMSGAKRKLPADIPLELRERVRSLAVEAFRALDCRGVARVDFLMDGESGELWVNEINTIPGSLSFYLWEPVGIPYARLLDEAVSLAFKHRREQAEIVYSFDANILAQFESGGMKGGKTGVLKANFENTGSSLLIRPPTQS